MKHSLAGTFFRLVAVAVLAVAISVGAWWLLIRAHTTSGTTGGSTASPTLVTGASAVSERTLEIVSKALDRPIYWAGVESAVTYELTQTSTGRSYVRYLPPGVRVGAPSPYLTVGTYPMTNAYAETLVLSRQRSAVALDVHGATAVAFYDRATPTNVYLAFAGSNDQIEVFDPSAAHAQELVSSGAIVPVNPTVVPSPSRTTSAPVASAPANTTPAVPSPAPVAASPAQLQTLAAKLGHSIYWLGSRSGSTYELTQTLDGRVYVRYLPRGVAVGDPSPYLTVATYPVNGAYATTKAAAHHAGNVTIPVAAGVAFYSPSHPTSVYLAFPGVNEQIEVFDPSASAVHALVAAAQVKPVP